MSDRELFSLDIETAATKREHREYAGLEPWRALHRTAHITSMSVGRPDGSLLSLHRSKMGDTAFDWAIRDALTDLRGKNVYAHNAVFDTAWLIASNKNDRVDPIPSYVRDIRWHDTLLLAKWVTNGQRADDMHFSYSLENLIRCFLREHPLWEEFVRMKGEKVDPGHDPYWERRNELDTIMTLYLAQFLEAKLPAPQRMGYCTEMRNIVPAANSWIVGLRIDQEKLERLEHDFNREQEEILKRIKIPASVLTSPKQLGHLLFTELGVKPESYTPTGSPRTSADDLKLIAFKLVQAGDTRVGPIMKDIMRFKEIATLKSKYVNGAKEALQHTGDGFIYGAPRIFGTYTGRFTYASKTLDTWKTGIALHQIPRKDKAVRSLLMPPPGHKVYEADASGQESRLMAIRSKDATLIKIFRDGLDFHAMTGSFIVGKEYEELVAAYQSGDLRAKEDRQMGKLTNLSCNYRTGGKKLAKKAFEDYDIPMPVETGYFVVKTFTNRYVGVPVYWDEAIQLARTKGYTETFGGRRYKIHDWSSTRRWESESSALMVPIQGSGASMKNIAIAEIHDYSSDVHFSLDLHDASFVWVPEGDVERHKRGIDEVLENIDYEKYWGFKPDIPLLYESMVGNNFSDIK